MVKGSINLMGPLEREMQSTVTAADLCDGGISVLNHCLSCQSSLALTYPTPASGLT